MTCFRVVMLAGLAAGILAAGCTSHARPQAVRPDDLNSPEPCLRQARSLLAQGQTQSAEGLLDKAIVRWPLCADLSLLRGYARLKLGKLAEAREDFTVVLRVSDHQATRVSAHLGLGATLERLGRQREADDQYALAVAIEPGLAAVLMDVQKNRLYPQPVSVRSEGPGGQSAAQRQKYLEEALRKLEAK